MLIKPGLPTGTLTLMPTYTLVSQPVMNKLASTSRKNAIFLKYLYMVLSSAARTIHEESERKAFECLEMPYN